MTSYEKLKEVREMCLKCIEHNNHGMTELPYLVDDKFSFEGILKYVEALEKAIQMLEETDHALASGELTEVQHAPREILNIIETTLSGEK